MSRLNLNPGLATFIEEQLAYNNICAMRLTSFARVSGKPFWTGEWSWYFPGLADQRNWSLYHSDQSTVMGVDTDLTHIETCAGNLLEYYIGMRPVGVSKVSVAGFDNLSTDLTRTRAELQRQLIDYWFPRLVHYLSEFKRYLSEIEPRSVHWDLSEITAESPTAHKNLALVHVNLIGYQCILAAIEWGQ